MLKNRDKSLKMIDQVDYLNDEVKDLALNLAIYLAKAKGSSEELARLEPEFIRLVNGTVKVVQEINEILNAANNLGKGEITLNSSPSGKDQIEIRLHSILDQCSKIRYDLSKVVNI